jgi:hypothetical protein
MMSTGPASSTSLAGCQEPWTMGGTSLLQSVLNQVTALLSIFITVIPASDCPPVWTKHLQSCYLLSNSSLRWSQAESACQENNSSLVSVLDTSVDTFLASLVPELWSKVFLGGYREDQAAVAWSWSNHSAWVYHNWLPGEPSNMTSTENCLCKTGAGGWASCCCVKPRQYICMMQLE